MIHDLFRYASQNQTLNLINYDYYSISKNEILFLIQKCKICQTKVINKSKDLFNLIILITIIEYNQTNDIDMRFYFDGKYNWICHIVSDFSKIHMMIIIENKTPISIGYVIHK